ncbi:hypothetical protein niasHS_010789 [Heterodera schachtii]|uniref:CCD97-like C-terminal domain-containing protein n=1 Tax=Heterodera schachtii TaxID=97005 RepID=A0ABD2ISM2_HETSC
MDSQIIRKLFESIISKNNVFYKSQQKDEDDLDNAQKTSILCDLYQNKPNIFLERYHQYIKPEFISLFHDKGCDEFYLNLIIQTQEGPSHSQLLKNFRYLALQELHREERHQLRPTIEISKNGDEFSKLLAQFDITQRVSDRRRRYLEEFQTQLDSSEGTNKFWNHVENRTVEADEEEKKIGADFTMEFDSSDEEGRETEQSRIMSERSRHRHCARDDDTVAMRRFRDRNAALKLKTEDEKASEALHSLHLTQKKEVGTEVDEFDSEPTGLLRDQLYNEFVSLMEQRFLDGKDVQFFDYSEIDAGHGLHGGYKEDRIYEQDMEDEYFDSEEPNS